jgi:hypothetical protein
VIAVRFRHDSTTSEWQFQGMDEQALRGMLDELEPYEAEPGSSDAVLTADADGTQLGAWNRGGAAHLASLAFRQRQTSPWTDIVAAVQGEVMDPHVEEQ